MNADRVWREKLATASSVTASVVNYLYFAVTPIGMWGYTPVRITNVYLCFSSFRLIDFYRASICEGGLGSRNSVCLSVCPSVRLSVTRVHCDKTK